MGLPVKLRHLPQRMATGAFILNSGIGKLNADEETAAQLHGFAVGTYPFLAKLKPRDFVRLLGGAEVTLGSALLLPVVPSGVAGAALAAFSGGCSGCTPARPGCGRKAPRCPPSRASRSPRTYGCSASGSASSSTT
jgi:hypothetical protein